jgi:hypothetical protein
MILDALGTIWESCSDLRFCGAPLRNRTVDLLLTIASGAQPRSAPFRRALIPAVPGWRGSLAARTSRSRWRGAPGGGMPPGSWPRLGSPRMPASRPTPPPAAAASGTPRPARPIPGTCGRCWPRGGCRMLGPAGADPGIPGAAGRLPRPAPRARRPGAAARCTDTPDARDAVLLFRDVAGTDWLRSSDGYLMDFRRYSAREEEWTGSFRKIHDPPHPTALVRPTVLARSLGPADNDQISLLRGSSTA